MIRLLNQTYRPNAKVTGCYTQPHRKYHDINHINYMLNTLDSIKDQLFDFSGMRDIWDNADFLATYWAVMYHDIVYNIPDPDKTNEELSAVMFLEDSGNWEYGYVVEQAILSTKTHILSDDAHTVSKVLVDLDLWALADETMFYKNNELIKAEVGANDEQWRVGRGAWLEQFLNRKQIYYTSVGQVRESKAREVLEKDLNFLKNG
jgi:predicted metal-dependent HD superfamily phosphohydrolase